MARDSGIAVRLDLEQAEPLPINTIRLVRTANVFQSHLSYGLVRPRRTSSLGFQRGGRIAKIYYEVGERVPLGERIAELQQDDLIARQTQLNETLLGRREQLTQFTRQNNVQQMTRLRGEIATLETQQQELTRTLEQGIIAAPFAGILASRDATESDSVPAGRPFFRLAEEGLPVIDVNVNLQLSKQLSVGSLAWVRRGDTQEPASVVTKSPQLDTSSQSQLFSLALSNETGNDRWVFGETVEVLFWTPAAKTGFWVPITALRKQANGLWAVFIVRAEDEVQLADEVMVVIEQLEDQQALVSGALDDGDLLVVDGLHRIVPGQRVLGTLAKRSFAPPGPPGAGE